MAGREEMREARRVKLTYDDFVQFPDDGLRHELIDGEHCVTPAPNIGHQRLVGRLHLALGNWVEEHPEGQLFVAPLDVVFTRFDVVEPDLVYVSNARASDWLNAKNATGADLVIEIGSPATRRRDETIKLQLYDRAGVSDYWFVDGQEQVVRVYRRNGPRFGSAEELSSLHGDVLTTTLLPGFELALARLFRD